MPPGEQNGDASGHELLGVAVAERSNQQPVAVPVPLPVRIRFFFFFSPEEQQASERFLVQMANGEISMGLLEEGWCQSGNGLLNSCRAYYVRAAVNQRGSLYIPAIGRMPAGVRCNWPEEKRRSSTHEIG